MSKAETADNTTDEFKVVYSLEDLEAPLTDMRSALGIVRKLALDCDMPPSRGEWVSAICNVERWAEDIAETLAAMIKKQDNRADLLVEQLAVLHEQRAVRGSEADIRHSLWLRSMLRNMAQILLQETEEGQPPALGNAVIIGNRTTETDITGASRGFGERA
jgi:hypothetical protein